MNIQETIIAIQKKLSIETDGKAGPETWSAIYAALFPNKAKVAALQPATGKPLSQTDRVDGRSEENIGTLLPQVQPYARALVVKAAAAGITIKIISGTRSYAEQDALYAKGRTLPGSRVTNAPGGHSNHNFGIAFDIGVFSGNSYLPESPKYKAVGVIGYDLGLKWGGSWKTTVDEPHFQLVPDWAEDKTERELLAGLRERKEAGNNLFAAS